MNTLLITPCHLHYAALRRRGIYVLEKQIAIAFGQRTGINYRIDGVKGKTTFTNQNYLVRNIFRHIGLPVGIILR